MSIFSETMTKAIGDYRFLLRRYLKQAERMAKLQKFKLRDSAIYKNDLMLFETGHAIVVDIEQNMETANQGYYSYSGIQEFCNYLKSYLENYHIENGQVVHRAQKASRALLEAIQLTTKPREQLDESVAQKLHECNETVVDFGSSEQCELQMQILERLQADNPGFYTDIIAHLESLMQSNGSEGVEE
ncbi:MAG: hypothetical protein A3E82_02885 [Gammaproteobacteria bacterium RIFCSPHIGHO2_12_FULL_38_11]|nr:MAG: hypothetical protein A3E82_02885 [Gammaproteobacteria bacterium RIFCSPHIGHO2_12_FULL_38_11]